MHQEVMIDLGETFQNGGIRSETVAQLDKGAEAWFARRVAVLISHFAISIDSAPRSQFAILKPSSPRP